MIIYKENKNIYWKLLSVYILSRIVILILEIEPVGEELSLRWQLMPSKLFEKDLFGTLYYLHYQPPIWNLIFGIFVKIVGTDYLKLANVLYFFNLFLSTISIYYFYLICNFFKLKKNHIYIIFLIYFIFSLSFLFYETYLHYMHLSVLVFAQLSYFYLKFSENSSLRFEILIYLTALFLAFLWSAFSHPLFMFVIFLGIFLIKYKKNLFRSFLIFLLFTFCTLSLSIKNKIEFNLFANSSWIGLQLMQVMAPYHQNHTLCGFQFVTEHNGKFIEFKDFESIYIKEKLNSDLSHPSLVGEYSRYNNIVFIQKTKECLKISLDLIYQDPLKFLNTVKFNFISTHGHFSFDHVGWEPKNWKKYFGFTNKLKENATTNFFKVRTLQLYYLTVYIFFGFMLIKNLFTINRNNKSYQKAFAGIFLIYIWLILSIHFGAGFEQERMRHLGHFLHILFFIFLLKNKFSYQKIKDEFLN